VEQIRVARSFIAADALADVVTKAYNLEPPVGSKMFSKLLRTQDNDHYRIYTGDGKKYVLRVYQSGEALGRQESDYLFELEWLRFLKERGLPVSHPLARQDGAYLGSLDAPEGKRYYALFTFAEGEPMSLSNMDQLYDVGVVMARIHAASDDFSSAQQRRALDFDYLLTEPLERIKQAWGNKRRANLDILLTSAADARVEIAALLGEGATPGGGSWGVIGGDFHSISTHFNAAGEPTFFNFDLCGYGWRAYDIAAFLSNTNLLQAPQGASEAFFAGYYSVRPLTQEEHAAVSPFLTIRRIWRMGLFALADGLAGYTFLAPA